VSIFCRHLFKPIKTEYAFTTDIDEGSIILPAFHLTRVNVYILTSRCLKCDKLKREEIYERT